MSKLKTIRENLGYKQEDIAELIGVSLPNYCKKENGDVKVSLIEAKKISTKFNMSIDEIFFNDEVSIIETN